MELKNHPQNQSQLSFFLSLPLYFFPLILSLPLFLSFSPLCLPFLLSFLSISLIMFFFNSHWSSVRAMFFVFFTCEFLLVSGMHHWLFRGEISQDVRSGNTQACLNDTQLWKGYFCPSANLSLRISSSHYFQFLLVLKEDCLCSRVLTYKQVYFQARTANKMAQGQDFPWNSLNL